MCREIPVRDALSLRGWNESVMEDRQCPSPVIRPKDKLTFPEGSHSPRWDWPGGCQWLKSECATGYHPGQCFQTCSAQLPLHRFWKGSAGVSSRASNPGWASPDHSLLSSPCSASSPSSFPFPNSTLFSSPIGLAPSRRRCIHFSERQKRLASLWRLRPGWSEALWINPTLSYISFTNLNAQIGLWHSISILIPERRSGLLSVSALNPGTNSQSQSGPMVSSQSRARGQL